MIYMIVSSFTGAFCHDSKDKERYDTGGNVEPTGIERSKTVEVSRNSFTRFRVVRDGLACGRLDMIHCSRIFMDCLSGDALTESPDIKPPVSSKNFCNAASATPTLMSLPVSQEIQMREPMRR